MNHAGALENLRRGGESFNGNSRDEHLSLPWFRNRIEAKVRIEQ